MSSDNPKTPPPLPEVGDSRLDRFLQRAAPIIASHRGINAKSRVLLEALARDIKLPPELFDQAIHMLQGAPPVVAKKKDRWVEAFCRYLHARLQDVPQGIVTVKMQERFVSKARRKYNLNEEQARQAIAEVSDELGLRRISRSEAERHVALLVEQKVADAEWLDDETTRRLHAAGAQWGLPPDQVDAIINRLTDENRRRRQMEQRTTVVALGGAAAIVIIFLVALTVHLLFGRSGRRPPKPPKVASAAAKAKPGPPPKPVELIAPPDWWGDTLAMACVQARVRLPAFGPLYPQLASADSKQRAAAYTQLADLCRKEDKGPHQLRSLMLDQVFSEAYVLEPNDEAAEQLMKSLLGLIETGDKLPQNVHGYDVGLWAASVAARALTDRRLSGPRATALEVALGQRLGASIHRSEDRQALERQCQAALVRRFYQQLTSLAPSEPYRCSDLHVRLSPLAARVLKSEEQNRLDAAFVGALLRAPGNAWTTYRDNGLIAFCLEQGDPLSVLSIVEALEQTRDRSLQRYLTQLLIGKLGIVPEFAEHESVTRDYAKAVARAARAKLGLKSMSLSTSDRWQQLRSRVDQLTQSAPADEGDRNGLLREAVELAHLGTLACALAQQEPGYPVFEQLLKDGPPPLIREEAETPSPRGRRYSSPLLLRPTRSQLERLDRLVNQLKDYESQLKAIRLTYLRGLAALTQRIHEIRYEQAAVIARYVLSPKDKAEHDDMLDALVELGRWQRVKLAVADQLPAAEISRGQLQDLVGALVGEPVELLSTEPWRQVAAQRLLHSVLQDLQAPSAADAARDPDRILDGAADALLELYKTRARLLGVAAQQYESAGSPGQLMRLLVKQAAAAGRPTRGSRPTTTLEHRLRVVDYLAGDDLRQTVMLQRLWLEQLAGQVARHHASRAGQAAELVAALQRRDVTADNLIVQLRDGERAILDMWMLYAPRQQKTSGGA